MRLNPVLGIKSVTKKSKKEHTVLPARTVALTLSKFTASQALEKALLPPPPLPNLHPLCRQREEL